MWESVFSPRVKDAKTVGTLYFGTDRSHDVVDVNSGMKRPKRTGRQLSKTNPETAREMPNN